MLSIKRFRILQTPRFLVLKIVYQKSREWQKNATRFTNTVWVCLYIKNLLNKRQ